MAFSSHLPDTRASLIFRTLIWLTFGVADCNLHNEIISLNPVAVANQGDIMRGHSTACTVITLKRCIVLNELLEHGTEASIIFRSS